MQTIDKKITFSGISTLLNPAKLDGMEEIPPTGYDAYIMPNINPGEKLWNELETQTLITSTSGRVIKSVPRNLISKKILERGTLLDNRMCVVSPNGDYEREWISAHSNEGSNIIEVICYHEELHSDERLLTEEIFGNELTMDQILTVITISGSQRIITVNCEDNIHKDLRMICEHLAIKCVCLDLEGNQIR